MTTTTTKPNPTEPPTRLARRLGVFGAFVAGAGAMIGAGVFSAVGPAARAAGAWCAVALAIAAVLAALNATSSARCAAAMPRSGGAYAWGRARLTPGWGFVAGAAFVVGKTQSLVAMALVFGAAAWPAQPRVAGVAAVLAVAGANLLGVRKSIGATAVLLVVVLATLGVVVLTCLTSTTFDAAALLPSAPTSPRAVLQGAAFFFFAFAGYARVATLGEEVRDPARTIPRAMALSLGFVLAVYALVVVAALGVASPAALGGDAPLVAAVVAAGRGELAIVVRVGSAVACLGVLLSLLLGASRTVFAMAGEGDAPRVLAGVHEGTMTPRAAVVATSFVVAVLVGAGVDLAHAVGGSSFCVLLYYAIAHAAAWTLSPQLLPRAVVVVGVIGCVAAAASTPALSVAVGASLVGAAVVLRKVALRLRRPASPSSGAGDTPSR